MWGNSENNPMEARMNEWIDEAIANTNGRGYDAR
jgi:hypothetical protein